MGMGHDWNEVRCGDGVGVVGARNNLVLVGGEIEIK